MPLFARLWWEPVRVLRAAVVGGGGGLLVPHAFGRFLCIFGDGPFAGPLRSFGRPPGDSLHSKLFVLVLPAQQRGRRCWRWALSLVL